MFSHSNFGFLRIGLALMWSCGWSVARWAGLLYGHSGLGALQTYAFDACRCQDPWSPERSLRAYKIGLIIILSSHWFRFFGLDDIKEYLILHEVCRFGHVNFILAQSQERLWTGWRNELQNWSKLRQYSSREVRTKIGFDFSINDLGNTC